MDHSRTVMILCTLLLFVGCGRKWCDRKYPNQSFDSIVYKETIKLDTITIASPPDTLMILLPTECPDQEIKAESKANKTQISIKGKIMKVVSICKEDSLQVVVNSLNKELKNKSEKVIQVKYIPKIMWYGLWIAFFIGIAIGFFFVRFRFW